MVLGSQPTGDIVINPVVSCYYFLPGPRLPFQPKSITALWLIANYTAWWQRHTCEQLAQSSYMIMQWLGIEPETSRLRVRHPTTTPPSHTNGEDHCRFLRSWKSLRYENEPSSSYWILIVALCLPRKCGEEGPWLTFFVSSSVCSAFSQNSSYLHGTL